MGSTKVPPLKTPDPAPAVVSATGQEAQNAKRNTRRNIADQYGRSKTILDTTGSTTGTDRKTILGG
jgi:hypothetical protein